MKAPVSMMERERTVGRRFTVLIRVSYPAALLQEMGCPNPESNKGKTVEAFEVTADDGPAAIEAAVAKAHRRFPLAGLVVKGVVERRPEKEEQP